ncbi:MAG: hypothetical protein E5Y02_26875 [Mesorhizobium sp.]|nr:MAG: hypothetical protein E5Y02_26875 [Mesorhizobium sp.]
MGYYKRWLSRGLRAAPVVGIIAAGWHSWDVMQRFQKDSGDTFKQELTYRCAARLPDDYLKSQQNEMGTINVRTACLVDRDFWVSMDEIAKVRAGTLKFEPYYKPYDAYGSLLIGVFWTVLAALATLGCLALTFVAHWVWGRKPAQ